MKNIIFTIGIIFGMVGANYAQLDPTTGNSTTNNNNFWTRAGNNQGNGGNLFGTRYNSPVYFITGGALAQNRRAKLNGIFGGFSPQYIINGYGGIQDVNTTGYFLLGANLNAPGGNIYEDLGAFSMLHLNGRDQPGVQEGGYRPWMKTGVTFTDNDDLSYMGIRAVGSGFDISETVIAWSDNQGTNFPGPDDMVFRFTSGGNGNTTISGNLNTPTDLDGRHVARFTPTGEFGLGNTFGAGSPLYVRPQSLLHMSLDGSSSVWGQFTNQNTGQNQNDGLRVGVLGANGNARNGNALIYQQENRHLLFSTRANTNQVNTNNTRERMRITSISAPTNLPGGGYGNYNPGNVNGNRTRVAISHNPNNPVTRPLSLLHLGYNTGSTFLPGTTDGWRSWMDVGMFVAQGTDNMYFGLKPEGNDRFDAVINWGDNQGALGPFPVGPDNLRFVFTSTTSLGSGDPISTSEDGLEMGRFEPTEDQNGLADSYGKLGVGDFYTTPTPVTHKLHVRGNGRFEYIPEEAAESIILGKVIDPSNPDDVSFRRLEFSNDPDDVLLGDGTWGPVAGSTDDQNLTNATLNGTILTIEIEDGNPVSVDLSNLQDGIGTDDQNLTGATLVGSILTIDIENGNSVSVDLSTLITPSNALAHNGTSRSTIDPNFVSFGQDVGDPLNPGVLLSNREVPMDGFNIEFNGLGVNNGNLVSFGQPNTVTGYIESKVHVYNDHEFVALTGYTDAAALVPFVSQQFGVSGYITNAESDLSAGVHGLAENSAPGMQGTGVFGEARDNTQNIGVRGTVIDNNSDVNFGGNFFAGGSAQTNYGIFCGASGGTVNDWAGFFQGDVFSGGTYFGSDAALKDNVNSIQNATQIINQLNPVTFDYKQNGQYERLNLPENNQFGMIAQDVETILPNLIKDITAPAVYDSVGNEVYPEMTFKGLDYEAFIPILTKGMQEQNSTIDSLSNELAQKDSLLNDVNDRLTQLENCLGNLLPLLCQINNSAIQQNDEEAQEALLHQINVELFDGENIILEQNIPNPFAERTVINYQIPTSVGDAKLLFYNNQGRMIRTVKINERGAGQVNVFGAELSKGTYSYTLVCDGEVISTKKMVKQ